MEAAEVKLKSNPAAAATWWKVFTFSYLSSLLRNTLRDKTVHIEDTFQVADEDTSQRLGDKLEKEWELELRKFKQNKKASLVAALFRAHGKYHLVTGVYAFVEELGSVLQPVFFTWLLGYFSDNPSITSGQAWCYSIGICVAAFMQSIPGSQVSMRNELTIARWRSATRAVLLKKVLKMPKNKIAEITTGHIIELSANDVPYVGQIIWPSHYMWIGPLKAVFGFLFLYNRVGRCVLAGYASIVLLAPIQFVLIKVASHWGKKRWKVQDERTQLMSEVITGMRVIKMYCWEKPFGKILSQLRKTQLNHSWYKEFFECLLLEVHQVNTRMVGVAMVVAAVLLQEDLDTAQVLTLLSIMTTVNHTLFTTATWGLKHLLEAITAMNRVQKFLLLDEGEQTHPAYLSPADSHIAIELNEVSASWSKDSVGLDNITMSINRGDLAVIIGKVGAGKSSVLQLLAGELHVQRGALCMDGTTIHAPQDPWIFPGTVRDNVLFGNEYTPLRYQDVIKATAFVEDIAALPDGDATLVGDRGVTLSGGQKARLSLARALYQDADIYLLDDPLSAVDAAVGRHIFNKCVMGSLKGKTRVLVTHQLQHIRQADKIIIMDQGKIACQGSFAEVIQRGIDLSEMLPNETHPERPETEDKSSLCLTDIKSLPEREEAETQSLGSTWKTLKEYLSCNPNMTPLYGAVVLNVLTRLLFHISDWWLAVGNNPGDTAVIMSSSSYVTCVLLLSACLFAIGTARGLIFHHYMLTLAHQSHDKMYRSVVRSPILFFDQNPSGRILNRFSSDLHVMDNRVAFFLKELMQEGAVLVFTVALNILASPLLVIPLVVLVYVVLKIRKFYITVRVGLLALESPIRSLALSHLKITMEGLDTVRSMGKTNYMRSVNGSLMDRLDGITFTILAAFNWFQFRMMSVVAIFTTFTTISFMMISKYTNPTLLGLSLSYLMPLMISLNMLTRYSAHIVLMMNKVERVLSYMKLPSEAPLNVGDVPKNWPSTGSIRFSDVSFRYKKEGPKVLSDVTFNITHGEKIGIVGRTGAGKSSLIQALFRMAEPEGEIIIDGIQTGSVGLHDVRSNISIIPQDPVLFSGSVRHNLDPFEEKSDDQIWEALAQVQMDQTIRELSNGLANAVVEGGANFSVGQRQLLCLARAILKQNKILVMDEATANVDRKTDEVIQEAIRKTFHGCTVLTIAHRLNTTMDADRIMVLNSGRVVEFDTPHVLLGKAGGALASLVAESGPAEEQRLRTLAKQSYERQSVNRIIYLSQLQDLITSRVTESINDRGMTVYTENISSN